MADETDHVQALNLMENETLAIQARQAAAGIPAGEPGNCKDCGEYRARLVLARCAPCRDGR